MRTPEEILEPAYDADGQLHLTEQDIKAIQDEAYNQALEDAIVEIRPRLPCSCTSCNARNVDVVMISRLKKTK